MANKNNILNEIKQISRLVAKLGTALPYQVPSGYFEELASRIIYRVKAQEVEHSTLALLKPDQKNPYKVPTGYFEALADSIIVRAKATEASSPKEELEVLSPLIGQLDKKPLFSIPTGYFEELPADVMDGLKAIDFVYHELETLSPVLNAAKNKNVYEVPEGYFEYLPSHLLNKIKSVPKATAISVDFKKKIFRFGIAALIAGVMAIGTLIFFKDRSSVNTESELAIVEKISHDEQISDDEILSYLDDNFTTLADNNITTSFDLQEEDVKELLTTISDEELQQYLEQNAASKDVITN